MKCINLDKTARLRIIRDEVFNLKKSPLYEYRKKNNYYPVLGEGSHNARIMFIGEAPGKNEAKTGRPFCGAAGKILDGLIEGIGLKRCDVYITNIIKDRPPNNRDPFPNEIEIYSPFLSRQIEAIQPRVIAALGRYSMNHIMRQYDLDLEILPISQAHGRIFETQVNFGILTIVPLYHPAVALYNRTRIDTLQKDFQMLKTFLK